MPETEVDEIYWAWKVACAAAADIAPDACDWTFQEVDSHPGIASIAIYKLTGPRVAFGRAEMESIKARYGWWALVYIFGHEIGHGVDFNIGIMDLMNDHQVELSADDWGGCFMVYAGAGSYKNSLTQVRSMINGIFDEGVTHPGPQARWNAFVNGWNRCYEE